MLIDNHIDVAKVRSDFPIFANNPGLHYLDSGASSQRPSMVLEAMENYYRFHHANVHRGVYRLAEEATELYESARERIGRFIGATHPGRETIFSKNSTEALNLVANSLGRGFLRQGDKVVITKMEHHANIVPWQMLAQYIGIQVEFIDVDDEGELIIDDLERIVDGAKVVSLTLTSNVLGTVTPFTGIAQVAKAAGAIVVGDASQFVPHRQIDVKSIGADLIAFTGHKMFGPTGIGVLWGRSELLDQMPPFLGGGDMISDVRLDGFVANELPYKFEAGTPPIAEAIGLGAAVDYMNSIGMDAIESHDREISRLAYEKVKGAFGDEIKIFGPSDPSKRSGCLSFELEGVHPHDVAQVLDQNLVNVRAGHHCAKPLMRHLGVAATARASFHIYNDEADVDALVDALKETRNFFI
ncbi:MAG: SufS family cysteine desulfurase [Actinomycetota bacterium]|nr:SufS family cysteine desulfurase [Actinomycetota bacterium]